MKVKTSIKFLKKQTILKFSFELQEGDKTIGISTHAGRNKIINLSGDSFVFILPLIIQKPHIDILAFVSLKILSPYIGNSFDIDEGVSKSFKEIISNEYPNIKDIKIDGNTPPFINKMKIDSVTSFSGGWDSMALHAVAPNDSPLIMMSKLNKHNLFKKTKSYNINTKPLKKMKTDKIKYLIKSDFHYVSTILNEDKNKFVRADELWYPSGYSYLVGAILMLDHLHFSTIMTGDILAAFTSMQRKATTNFTMAHDNFFSALGTPISRPLAGCSEYMTSYIVLKNGLNRFSSPCEINKHMDCMKCVKCFRKNLYKWSISQKKPLLWSDAKFTKFKHLEFIVENTNESLKFMLNYKLAFQAIDYNFKGIVGQIKSKTDKCKLDPQFLKAINNIPYERKLTQSEKYVVNNLKKYFEFYDDDQKAQYLKMNQDNLKDIFQL